MKISVSGKGGSGKSTVTTLLALEARDQGYHPIVIDSDESNMVLYRLLGFAEPPAPLVDLAGGRQMVRKLLPPKYAPGKSEVETNVLSKAEISITDIPSENISEKDGVRLIIIGKIQQPLEGCACPMGVLGREFLGKLRLGEKDIAIADMEAGIEHLGRGFESSIDGTIIVVEPSFESIVLAEKIKQLASKIGVAHVWVILNKVSTKRVANSLKKGLSERGVSVIGTLPYDESVFEACLEGKQIMIGRAGTELKKIFDTFISRS